MMNRLIFVFVFILVSSLSSAQIQYNNIGIASYYADKFEGRQTANGEIYYHAKRTAAHRTLPFGSVVKVTNLENNKYVVVRINDRGPFVDNRIIDLSKSAAKELEFVDNGLAKVRVELIASTEDLTDNVSSQRKDVQSSNYFNVQAEKVSLNGKGIQIGSFKNNENVFRLIEELNTKYNEQVYIEITQVKNQNIYRIIVGNYSSEAKLEALKKVLSMDYPGCFVVTYK